MREVRGDAEARNKSDLWVSRPSLVLWHERDDALFIQSLFDASGEDYGDARAGNRRAARILFVPGLLKHNIRCFRCNKTKPRPG
jgi:hypothetical protein